MSFKETTANSLGNFKNFVAPRKINKGSVENQKIRIYKYKDYDKKITTYKIVKYIPKTTDFD